MDIPSLIIMIGLSVLIAGFVFISIILAVQNKILRSQKLQAELDLFSALMKLTATADLNENLSVEKTDGFLKFVSDSREWAFEYIENVQDALAKFKQVADGLPVNKEISIELAEEYSKAYEALVDLLPKEDSDGV